MPDDVLTRPSKSVPEPGMGRQEAADARDLAGFGYKQELKRVLGVYSSFAVAFSYISPSTGICAELAGTVAVMDAPAALSSAVMCGM